MAYVGFQKRESKLAAQGKVRTPGAVAASIAVKKYGQANLQKHAASGTSMRRAAVLHHMKGTE